MHIARTVTIWAALAGAAAAAPANRVLTMEGFEAVHFGMTVAEAEKALGEKLEVDDFFTEDVSACAYYARKNEDAGVLYMAVHGLIQRIEIVDSNKVRTAEGLGIGSTEDEVKKAYGANVKVTPDPYTGRDGGHWLTVDSPDHKRAFVFETDKGKVDTFRSGLHGPVDYIEGCL